MHPLIAFFAFIFSPAQDWTLKQGFELVLDPQSIPGIVEQYDRLSRHYPSDLTIEGQAPSSLDINGKALWAEILYKNGHHEKASDSWSTLLENPDLDPHMADSINLRLGEMHYLKKNWDSARDAFTLVLKNRGPRQLDAMTNLLLVEMAAGNWDEAHHHAEGLEAYLDSPDQMPRTKFPLGLLAYKEGRFQDAIKTFEGLEGDPKAQYFAGLAHRGLNEHQKALAQWQKINRNHPFSPWAEMAQFQVAETYFQLDDYELSRKVTELALENEPSRFVEDKLNFRLATLHMKKNEPEMALAKLYQVAGDSNLMERAVVLAAENLVKVGASNQLFESIERLHEDQPTLVRNYQKSWAALFDGKLDKAMDQSNQGLESFYDPDLTPRLLLLQGLTFEKAGQGAEALATYQIVADRFPRTISAAKATHFTLLAYIRNGRIQEALTHGNYLWEKIPKGIRKETPDIAFWLGESFLKSGKYEDANKKYGEFLTLAGGDHPLLKTAQFQQSLVLAQLGHFDESLAMLDQFSTSKDRIYNPSSLAHIQKGHIFFNQKQYENAVASYRAAGPVAKAQYYEGLALYRRDYYTDAISTWARVLDKSPKDPFAELAMYKTGRTQFELGQSTNAVATFAQFIKRYPQNPQVQFAQLQSAHALYNAGYHNEAAQQYQAYLKKYRSTEDLISVTPYLASTYAQLNKSVDEIDNLMRGLPPTDVASSMRWEKGATLFNQQDYAQATGEFAEFLSVKPAADNAPQAQFYRAESLYLSQSWKPAQAAYETYLNFYKDENVENKPLALFRKGASFFQDGNLMASASTFEKFLKFYPEENLATDAKENLLLSYHFLGNWEAKENADLWYKDIGPRIQPGTTVDVAMANTTSIPSDSDGKAINQSTDTQKPGRRVVEIDQNSRPAPTQGKSEVAQAE